MNTRDSHLPRALKLDAFLAIQCLGDKILAAVKSSVTFMTTRSTWLLPRPPLVAAIMLNGSVKWRGVSITYGGAPLVVTHFLVDHLYAAPLDLDYKDR